MGCESVGVWCVGFGNVGVWGCGLWAVGCAGGCECVGL